MTEPETSQETPVSVKPRSAQGLRDRVAELVAANKKLKAELARESDVAVLADDDRQTLRTQMRQLAGDLDATAGALADETQSRRRAEEALTEKSLTLDDTLADLRGMVELLDLAHDTIFAQDMDGRITFWNRGAERTYGWTKTEALGKISHELLKTEFSAPLIKLMVEMMREGYWEGELVHTARDGRRVVVASRWALRRDGSSQPVAILEIDNDITGRKEAEAKAEAERKRLFSVLNMFPGYTVLKDRAYNIRFASHGFLDVFSDPQGRPCYQVQYGLDAPCDRCPIPAVLDGGQTRDWEYTYPNGKTFHVWAFPFREADGTDMLLEFAVDVTDRKKLELLISETSEAEHRRIGRDLHDTLGQSLTGLGYLIGGLAERLSAKSPEDAAAAEQLIETVNEAVGQVRALARGLDPVGLEAGGLANALSKLAETLQTTSNVPCEFRCDCPVSLSASAATHLYRIAQEALNNAARHSRAKKVTMELTETARRVVLRITDDGVGVPDGARDGEGMGLRTMHYRAGAIGAQLTVRPAPEAGTVVACTLRKPGFGPGSEGEC